LDNAIQQEEARDYVKRSRILKSNVSTIFSIIWGQCSNDMKNKLRYMPGYSTTSKEDCVWLLEKTKGISLKFDEKRNGLFLSALNARNGFLSCAQKSNPSNVEYCDELKSWADTIKFYGGTVAESHEMVPVISPVGSTRSVAKRKKIASIEPWELHTYRRLTPTDVGSL
jgi:hypothetical protein